MSSRYADAASELIDPIDRESTGMGLVLTSTREQGLVADALHAAWPGSERAVLSAELVNMPGQVWIATLPTAAEDARDALIAINEARQRITALQRLFVLVVTRTQVLQVQKHAADMYSIVAFIEKCPFVPDASVVHEEARQQLAGWYRQRLGKLDLRGFIRAQTEDVAWAVEDIYQELEADSRLRADAPVFGDPHSDRKLLIEHLEQAFTGGKETSSAEEAARFAVILGHPGSGKSFFLRCLALRAVAADTLFGVQAPLPILLSLAAYARMPRPANLYDYIIDMLLEAEQDAAHVLDRAVQNGQMIFLLDGLDEVGDESGRRHVAAAVRELGQRAPGCLIVATSRITGYTEAPLPGPHWELAPFSNDAIERFVIAWCELYARELHGATGAARGRQEGQRLAQDIRSNPQVRALAKNPLLLTVLAIVHRAGVRLPDHRVELYSHATQVLVERWNQVRSMAGTGAVIPIKTSDAVRLLGPVALEMVRTGTRGAIPEDSLRRSLDRTLESGRLRTLTSADEAIQLFQHSLGLLVEQGPGTYAFMHLTLAEYFAARELVRGNEFEKLAGDPKAAFSAEWREIILLAAGELGVIRADDTRLEHLVDTLIDSAGRRRGKPSPVVPSLLAGLLADDPSLSQRSARAIIDTLIPTWWFEQDYGRIETLVAVMADSASLRRRILQGRFKSMIEEVSDTMFENLNKAIERYPDGESRQRRNE